MAEAGEPARYVQPDDLVRTYDPRGGMDPVELVEQYHRVLDCAAEHPSLGSGAIATRLDLPRERIRTWIRDQDPSVPDCVRCLQTAAERGLLRAPNRPAC